MYNQRYFNQLVSKNLDLIDNIMEKKYEDWAKDNYFQKKNSVGDVGVIEINNSCNINCVMCDTKSSTRPKKLMNLDTELDEIFEEMKEIFKKLVFKSMIYRDIHMDMISDKLQESFDKISPELKEQLK